MKKMIIGIIMILIFLISMPSKLAVVLTQGDTLSPSGRNTDYLIANTLTFDSVIINNDSLFFNDNLFAVDSNVSIKVHLTTYGSGGADMEFLVNATTLTNFIFDGFTSGERYELFMDNISQDILIANSTGGISFSYDGWSLHYFSFDGYSPEGSGSNKIICYRCYDGELQTSIFKGTECPDGWTRTPFECEEEKKESTNGGDIFFIFFLVVVFVLVFSFLLSRKGGKK